MAAAVVSTAEGRIETDIGGLTLSELVTEIIRVKAQLELEKAVLDACLEVGGPGRVLPPAVRAKLWSMPKWKAVQWAQVAHRFRRLEREELDRVVWQARNSDDEWLPMPKDLKPHAASR